MSDPKDTTSVAAEKVSDIADQAVGAARETGRRARAAAGTAYGRGNGFVQEIEDATRQNPLRALLVAGAIGLGIGRHNPLRALMMAGAVGLGVGYFARRV